MSATIKFQIKPFNTSNIILFKHLWPPVYRWNGWKTGQRWNCWSDFCLHPRPTVFEPEEGRQILVRKRRSSRIVPAGSASRNTENVARQSHLRQPGEPFDKQFYDRKIFSQLKLFTLLNRVKTCFKMHFSENSIPFLSYHSLHRLCDRKLVVYRLKPKA